MKTTKILITVLVGFLFFSSCQKPFTDELLPLPQQSARVKTYTEDFTSPATGNSVETFNLNYDANNRLISMISATSVGDKFIYQYSGNTITMDFYRSNELTIHEVSYLNSSSFVDSTFQYNDTEDSSTEKYLYNSNNQLVKLTEYDYTAAGGAEIYNTHNYFYDADGNLTRETDDYSQITYEYSTLLNTLFIGFDHLPHRKYLVKTTRYSFGATTGTINHTYTFDSSNRLTSEKTISDTGEIAIKSYTYY